MWHAIRRTPLSPSEARIEARKEIKRYATTLKQGGAKDNSTDDKNIAKIQDRVDKLIKKYDMPSDMKAELRKLGEDNIRPADSIA